MSNQSPNQQTNEEMPSGCFTQYISPEDGFGVVEGWLRTGDYNNPDDFAKHLPHTTKDLKLGRLNYDVVSSSLEATYLWVINKDKTASLRHLTSLLAVAIVPKSLSNITRSLFSVQLGRMIYFQEFTSGRQGTVFSMQSSLSELIESVRSFFVSEEGINKVKWQLGEDFSRDSDLFNFTEAEFVTRALSCMEGVDTGDLWRECEEMRRAANGFTRITSQHDSTFHTCWACSKVFEKIFHCSRCKAAAYCSQECQAASWKTGHKAKCGRLKMAHNLYHAGVEQLAKVHATGVIDGFDLCAFTDVQLLIQCTWRLVMGLERGPSRRSMKNFYENLGRIIRGEWWVYDMSDQTGSTQGVTDDTPIYSDIHTFMLTPQFVILFALTMDWFGNARRTIGTDDPEKVTAWADPFFRQTCGPPISPEALLAFYVSPLSSSLRVGRVNYTLACYDSLREVHNACN